MKRRIFLAGLGSVAALAPIAARAQQATPVIGFLSGRRPDDSDDVVTAFRDGLGESGYVEGRNVAIEFRWAGGQYDRLPGMASDLVQRRVDVIFTNGGLLPAQAAKKATDSIPIVFEAGSDPVRLGLVPSFNRPGGHVTGVTMFSGVVLPKRMELLREIAPGVTSIGLIHNPASANVAPDTADARAAAATLGLPLHIVHVSRPDDVDRAFASLIERRVNGLVVAADPFVDTQRNRIVALAAQYRIPAVYAWRFFVEAGGLLSYGSRIVDAYHQGGIYTGRVLRGEKPGDLPIVQPTRFYLDLNAKTANALGITVPQSLQIAADNVIE